ncbi:MAG: hypothetical protein K8D98_01105, partial [Rhodanobacter sp.]|nr:hypothetical protein [Rhodanobacter sp.]
LDLTPWARVSGGRGHALYRSGCLAVVRPLLDVVDQRKQLPLAVHLRLQIKGTWPIKSGEPQEIKGTWPIKWGRPQNPTLFCSPIRTTPWAS